MDAEETVEDSLIDPTFMTFAFDGFDVMELCASKGIELQLD